MTRRSVRLAAILTLGITVACVTVRSAPATSVDARRPTETAAPLLAFTERGPMSDSEIHVMRADGTGHRVLTKNRLNDLSPAWSPRGRWLTYVLMRRNGVPSHYAREADGRRLVYIGGMLSGAGWSRDERWVLTWHRTKNHLQVVDMETGARNPIFAPGWGYLEGFGWSPDGDTILFAARRYNDFDVPNVFAADPDGSRLRRLVRNGTAPASSPDGRLIGFVRDVNLYYSTVYVVRPDGSGLRRLSPVRIDPEMWRWSPDGRRIAVVQDLRNADPRLGVLDVERGGVSWLSAGRHLAEGSFQWTPSGKQILFLCGSFRRYARSTYGLCLANVETGRTRKITGETAVGYGFKLSPDGQRVLFSNDRGVYVFDLGARRLRRMTSSGSYSSWSPDGEWIVVQLRTGLHAVRLSDGRVQAVTRNIEATASWQPQAP